MWWARTVSGRPHRVSGRLVQSAVVSVEVWRARAVSGVAGTLPEGCAAGACGHRSGVLVLSFGHVVGLERPWIITAWFLFRIFFYWWLLV